MGVSRFGCSTEGVVVERDQQIYLLKKSFENLIQLSKADLLTELTSGGERVDSPTMLNPTVFPILGAGVTFNNSLRERRLETFRAGALTDVTDDGRPTPYDVVYDPQNPPEVFFKATMPGHLAEPDELWIRPDGAPDGSMGSSVPEPERVLIVNPEGEIIAHTIGSDTTARQLESMSPLYLPAAKTYPGCTTLCPWLTLYDPETVVTITMEIFRAGVSMYLDAYRSDQSKRTPESLVRHARTLSGNPTGKFESGFALFTGTGIIPPVEFSLESGDVVEITSVELGSIRATTKVVTYQFGD